MQFFFTPLEQFDQVVWLVHSVAETMAPYVLFIFETEFDRSDLYLNHYAISSSSSSFILLSNWIYSNVDIFLFGSLFVHFRPILPRFVFKVDTFIHIFFLGLINIFTSFFVIIWFTDFFYVYTVVNASSLFEEFNFENTINVSAILENTTFIVPQIDFTFALDEIRITLLLGFFLIGGGEIEDEDDFFLSNNSDLTIVEDVVAPLFVANLGKNILENGALYLKVCTIFSFVLISNFLGMIPYGDTATSSLLLTFWVSFSVFAALVTLIIRKHGVNYFFSLFIPSGCPLPLIFLLIPIEFLSYSFRLVSLAVRLFANRMAGHTLRKVLIGFSYVMFTLGDGYAIAAFLPALVVFVLIFLEMAVAAIQAYIFTILICIYLKDLYVSH